MKVEDGNDLQVGAPMKGEVLDIKVAMGEVVEKGQGKYQICINSFEDVLSWYESYMNHIMKSILLF